MALRLSLFVFVLTPFLFPKAHGEIIENLPDAVVCSVKDPTGFLPWEELVFYVSAHTRDGNTLYKTLTSDPVVLIINEEGVIDASNLADCDGRHISSLLESGRAFHLTR
ncbi:MAG: hypothetical protein AB8B95_08565 [Pseudohongiellaceae bacterium]